MKYGLYIDYDWCSGCHACELACKQENDLKTDQWGIRVIERGHGVVADHERVALRDRARPFRARGQCTL